MELFRHYIQQEYLRRSGRNPRYSLRSFARSLDIDHGTLSRVLGGKRRLSPETFEKLAKSLGLDEKQRSKMRSAQAGDDTYDSIDESTFYLMSDWYFDAILELIRIRHISWNDVRIAKSLGIHPMQARTALEILGRLGLIESMSERYALRAEATTNLLDEETTSAAHRSLQRALLERSLAALDQVPREERDHTSTTMAIRREDLGSARELIKKFRRDLDGFLQKPGVDFDSVYQLQVSFFPLTKGKVS